MNDDRVLEIADLCLAIEKKAAETYAKFAESSSGRDLQQFWLEMVDAEKSHITFWNGVEAVAKEHPLPHIFDDPEPIRNELEQLGLRISALSGRWEASKCMDDASALAFRLEFAMAHPAFAMFFHTLGLLAGPANPEYDYDLHINHFVHVMTHYWQVTPELQLLAETLQSQWQTNKVLTKLVTLDGLTGLLNRQGFYIFARQLAYLAHRNKENIAVLIIDVDGLKELSDLHGASKGDDVLKGVAEVVKSSLRRSDVVGRYRGEAFIILFPAIQPESLQQVAEQLRYQIEIAKPGNLSVTVSMGAAQGKIHFDPEAELDPLIAKADKCLDSAKASGRNRIVYRV